MENENKKTRSLLHRQLVFVVLLVHKVLDENTSIEQQRTKATEQPAKVHEEVPRVNGARLAGPALTRTKAGELPPEGLVLGAVQVPADGQPLIFLADHPTTGGYPVIGVVDDVTPLAQARPGTKVRFRAAD